MGGSKFIRSRRTPNTKNSSQTGEGVFERKIDYATENRLPQKPSPQKPWQRQVA